MAPWSCQKCLILPAVESATPTCAALSTLKDMQTCARQLQRATSSCCTSMLQLRTTGVLQSHPSDQSGAPGVPRTLNSCWQMHTHPLSLVFGEGQLPAHKAWHVHPDARPQLLVAPFPYLMQGMLGLPMQGPFSSCLPGPPAGPSSLACHPTPFSMHDPMHCRCTAAAPPAHVPDCHVIARGVAGRAVSGHSHAAQPAARRVMQHIHTQGSSGCSMQVRLQVQAAQQAQHARAGRAMRADMATQRTLQRVLQHS